MFVCNQRIALHGSSDIGTFRIGIHIGKQFQNTETDAETDAETDRRPAAPTFGRDATTSLGASSIAPGIRKSSSLGWPVRLGGRYTREANKIPPLVGDVQESLARRASSPRTPAYTADALVRLRRH